MISPRSSTAKRSSGFSTEEFRAVVARAEAKGLIKRPAGQSVAGKPVAIEKAGRPVSDLAGAKTQLMVIDPAKAEHWLKNNFRNRPISEDVVRAYAADMTAGRWTVTHQGLAFNDRDELIDGQHRLRAIILSGCTVQTMVTFGLPSKIKDSEMTTMDCVDRGRTRSVADQLKIQHGMKHGSVIAALAAALANICEGRKTRRLSVGQTLEIYRAFGEHAGWVIERRPKKPGMRATGVLAGFVFALAAAGEEAPRIRKLYQSLMSQVGPGPKTAMLQLRRFLTSDDAKLLNRGTDRGLAELVLEAIRLDLAGGQVERLELSPAGVAHFKGLAPALVATVSKLFLVGDGIRA